MLAGHQRSVTSQERTFTKDCSGALVRPAVSESC